jgi:hypothetical protein
VTACQPLWSDGCCACMMDHWLADYAFDEIVSWDVVGLPAEVMTRVKQEYRPACGCTRKP